jgi:putative transposase
LTHCRGSTGAGCVWMRRGPRPRGAGKKTGPHPPDRATGGVKRRLVPEGHGVPLGLALAGAKRHDMKLVRPTRERWVVERPPPTAEQPQGRWLEQG